jgi:Response regulators consisting of a CheY-like receiver domain and a winged-helix DNA-binding domain
MILIAEDNPANHEFLTELLTAWGYDTAHAVNGVEVLSQLETATPDLILLDLQMPGLDGYGVLRQVAADERLSICPSSALTAFAMRGDREKALELGFDGYLTKPIDSALLRQVVIRFCGERSRHPGDGVEVNGSNGMQGVVS